MALQYNFVFDRKGGGHQLNNPYWEQWVSTLKPPEGSQLADGTYSAESCPGELRGDHQGRRILHQLVPGPLSLHNHRGQNQFIPENLQSFTSPIKNVPANPSLPDNQRDVQFTVNGQFQPELKLKPGQTEIWVLANISDFAYMPLRFTETATGNASEILHRGPGRQPLHAGAAACRRRRNLSRIPPASRYAIAVTMPKSGDLVLDMPPKDGVKGISEPGVLYTNNGTKNSPAVLGTATIDPKYISCTGRILHLPDPDPVARDPDIAARARRRRSSPARTSTPTRRSSIPR